MKAHTVEHPLQRAILRALSKADMLRFSELKPGGVENNIFMYHIYQLVRDGLVAKDGSRYMLTPEGMRHVALVTRGQLEHRMQPKLFSFLVLRNSFGEVALHRRASQPFMHRFAFPGEVIYFGEFIDDHKQRLLHDKVGIGASLSLRGLVDSKLMYGDQVVSHVYAQLLCGEVEGRPALRAIDDHFAPQWVNINQIGDDELLPDIPEILKTLDSDQEYFFQSIIKSVAITTPPIPN